LPGGKAAVFTDWTGGSFDDARIALVDLDSGERRVLLEGGTAPRYAPSGFLLYARSGILQAVRFDPTQLRVSGQPAPIINGVMTDARTGAGQFSVAGDTVVYVPGTLRIPELSVVLVARSGQTRPLMAARQAYGSPRLSPDGRRLAVAMSEGTNRNVWIYDLALTRFTLGGGTSTSPCWSPDGKRLVFTSTRAGAQNLFWAPADGGGPEVQLTASPYPQVPNSWSPDGRWLLFTERRAGTSAQRIERHHVDLEALGRTQISLEVCLRRRSM
jgi:WD40 repeat protein